MDSNDEQVKGKAHLLLQRETELFRVRAKHEQLASWLKLAQSLPQLIDGRLSTDEIYGRLRKALITGMRIPSVSFLEVRDASLRPIAPSGSERPCDAAAVSLYRSQPWGICDDAADGPAGALTQAVGLHRFIWGRVQVAGAPSVLLTAGYTREKAKYHPGFDEADAAHLGNTAKYVETLLSLHATSDQLRVANQTLEQKVRERTEQLGRRNRDMRLVLDNVEQAFLTIDIDGNLAEERSSIVDHWFGPYPYPARFVDYMAKSDPEFATYFALGHAAFVENLLPRELCIDQLPSSLRSGGRQFRCTYLALPSEGQREGGLLIVINDVTDHLRRTQEEAEQRELLAVAQGLMSDRSGYLVFFDEATQLVAELASESVDHMTRRRLLHTLKGNAAMFRLDVVAALCHHAESELDGDRDSAHEAVLALQERWEVVANTVWGILGKRGRGVLEVFCEDVDALSQAVLEGAAREDVRATLASWKFEPVERYLARLAQYAVPLAKRLGKGDIVTAVRAPELRLEPQTWSSFWSVLVHLVRNAVDHGIESPAERIAAAKPLPGRLELAVSLDTHELIIAIRDDGRGIDWKYVDELAAQRGFAHGNQRDLVKALLDPSFTTLGEATTTSGRGIGLAAVDVEVRALGGTLTVESRPGEGTVWRCSFPASVVASSAWGPRAGSTASQPETNADLSPI